MMLSYPYLFRRLPRFGNSLFVKDVCTRWSFTPKNRLYLTFDDGPHPEITEQVLEILAKYEAEATFFLLGKNVETHRTLAHKILDAGHGLGNHSYSHLDGWKTDTTKYWDDVKRCQWVLPRREEPLFPTRTIVFSTFNPEHRRSGLGGVDPSQGKKRKTITRPFDLFRPPYGRITWSQYKRIGRSGFITVLWTHLSLDFRPELSSEKVLQWLVESRYKTGDIIVFHDSEKAAPRMLYALPRFIETMMEKGYIFESLV